MSLGFSRGNLYEPRKLTTALRAVESIEGRNFVDFRPKCVCPKKETVASPEALYKREEVT